MNVCFSLSQIPHQCSVCAHRVVDNITQKIKAIWERIVNAYNESSRQLPKLVLPAHSIPNTYPKLYKNKGWPNYLNLAWGRWGSSDNLETMAKMVEPHEKVTTLHAATLGNNMTGIYRLIANGANVTLGTNMIGIYRLIANGADVNAEDIRGQTPAYWAAYHGNLNALMIFKNFGAQLNQKDFRGKTLMRAAAKYGHDDIILFLASQKVNLNTLDGKGLTPLHVAAFNGRFSTYEKLILNGADTTIRDSEGRTAEEILKMKYAELYHNRWFLSRLFSSSNPPALSIKPCNLDNLRTHARSLSQ